jgi:uncharacterized membrane protein YeiH
VLIRQVPGVLGSGLYAIPALAGAGLVVLADSVGVDHVPGAPAAFGAAGVCFLILKVGLHFRLDARSRLGLGARGPKRPEVTVVAGEPGKAATS